MKIFILPSCNGKMKILRLPLQAKII